MLLRRCCLNTCADCMAAKKKIHTVLERNGSIHMIPIPAAAAAHFVKTGSRRVLCTINSTHTLHAALLPRKGSSDCYIFAGKALLKKMGIAAGAKLLVQLEADNSDYQFDMPEELAEVLDTDSEAHHIFHALTPGRQRGLIQLVLMVKASDKKIERALKIADKIKAGITSPQLVMK
jgi:Bacteriocin-protection, YdeI or OmpD-Associated/Domain of unknown function (DUF1905)